MSDRREFQEARVVDASNIAALFSQMLIRAMQQVVSLPPRLLTAKEAADYTGRSLNTFLRGVDAGEWPQPIPESRDLRLWDRYELDAEIDRRRGKPSITADEHALDRKFGT